ncbi:carbohydrate ABC transporter permease [Clostridium diolis]|uniref:Sugar ABC transporter permease n=1 Tax=Clostridium diolis TaxID=223919 RepID=A0AAV3W2Q3_9CLOT|nr:carbohydrate ABC transporter permease [Clostridium diolis]QES73938.1 carbohydrate ABC transporter permease [Clostridium diolis]GEA31264.1 sugar ABC transporter permease [Clostridium diolis]
MEERRYIKPRTNIILNIIAVIVGAIFLFPLYWVIISSFKSDAEIFRNPPTFFPEQLTLSAYAAQITGEYSIFKGFFNSCFISFSVLVITLLFAVPSAYGLARYRIKGKKLFIQSFLITQMLPATLLLTPMFIIFGRFRILNTYLSPILADCTISIPFVVIILRTYFLSIPKELEDSARVDGCNTFQAFIRIILPVSYPGIIMAAVFSFLFAWGDLIFALTFMNEQSMRPMTAGIYNFMGQYGLAWNKIMAFGTLTIIPVVAIFIFMQKYIIGGLASGAVKE